MRRLLTPFWVSLEKKMGIKEDTFQFQKSHFFLRLLKRQRLFRVPDVVSGDSPALIVSPCHSASSLELLAFPGEIPSVWIYQ